MASNPLVGTWKLVACETRSVEGHVSYPWGRAAAGYLYYLENGMMSVTIADPQRPRFGVSDIKGGTLAEKAAAAESYLTYCGRYEQVGENVIHHVELCLFPNWIGTEIVRQVTLAGNRLSLASAPFLVEGIQQSIHLLWERV